MRGSLAWYSLQILSVPSVEALSEISSSKSEKVWESRESNASGRYFSPLWTGMPMLRRGSLLLIIFPILYVLNLPTFRLFLNRATPLRQKQELCQHPLFAKVNVADAIPQPRAPPLLRRVWDYGPYTTIECYPLTCSPDFHNAKARHPTFLCRHLLPKLPPPKIGTECAIDFSWWKATECADLVPIFSKPAVREEDYAAGKNVVQQDPRRSADMRFY